MDFKEKTDTSLVLMAAVNDNEEPCYATVIFTSAFAIGKPAGYISGVFTG